MVTPQLAGMLRSRYPCVQMRGRQIARLEERPLGWFNLDLERAAELGVDQVGVFVSALAPLPRVVKCLEYLDQQTGTGCWLVVPATSSLDEYLHNNWHDDNDNPRHKKPQDVWCSRTLTFATPERLKHVHRATTWRPSDIAGIIVIDPDCVLHRARGITTFGRRIDHDRPQLVANLRGRLTCNGWCPPLFLWTMKRAKELGTERIADIFCLNSFIFVDGCTFSCKERSHREEGSDTGPSGQNFELEAEPSAREPNSFAAKPTQA